jgi:hypothetical protein
VGYQPPASSTFSLRTNQPPTTNQQYFSLRTSQHQPNEQGSFLVKIFEVLNETLTTNEEY